MNAPEIGFTKSGYSFTGGDPSDSQNWLKIGTSKSGYSFSGGDPAVKENWEPIIDNEEEASIGPLNRLKYAIEPIQSNRKAGLEQAFGEEGIIEKDGELYRKEGEVFRPLNKPGVSSADFADLAGAVPEMVGGVAGTVAGLVGAGGVGAVPLAVAGGAAGSVARQALSAAMGTPQVASAGERAIETGMSAGLSGLGAGAGQALKSVAKNAAPYIKKVFPSLKFSDEGLRFAAISKKEGIPAPTASQIAGGRALEQEKLLAARPFWGRAVRKKTEEQVDAVKSNLKNVVGDFMSTEVDRGGVGLGIKDASFKTIKGLKDTARAKFDTIASEGSDISIKADTFKKQLSGQLNKLGLFDDAGNPLAHTSKTGLTETQFSRLQGIFKKVIDDVDNIGMDGTLDVNTVNTMRKFLDANIKEGENLGFDDVLLIKAKESFLDVTENMLEAKSKDLRDEFRAARSTWAEAMNANEIFSKGKGLGIRDLSEERVVDRVMKDKKSVQQLKKLVGQEQVEGAAVTYLHELMKKNLGKESQIGAKTVMNTMVSKREAFIEAMGKEKYNKVINNLIVLDRIGEPVNPSKTFISELMSSAVSPTDFASGAAQRAIVGAKNLTTGLAGSLDKSINNLPQISSKTANILTDSPQRSLGYTPKNGQRLVSEREKEAEKRQRALAGQRK